MSGLDTHTYDGKLCDKVKTILEKFDLDCSFEECINDIKNCAAKIKYDRTANLNAVLALFMNDRRGNYDPTNDARVEDILPRLWKLVKERDGESNIFEIERKKIMEIYGKYDAGLAFEKLSDNDKKEIFKIKCNARLVMFEQIADITGGPCPQGRCTRLIQLFDI